MKYTLMQHAKLPDQEKKQFLPRDILMAHDEKSGEGRIVAIRQALSESECSSLTGGAPFERFSAGNRPVLPAFLDTHCHLRDPGFTYKEDIESGTRAALFGGYAGVTAMPNTNPVTDNAQTVRAILEKARRVGLCRVLPTCAITVGMKSETLVDFEKMAEEGVVAFTDDGKPVMTAALLYKAMKACAKKDYLIMSHCEEMSLAAGGAINEGAISRQLGVGGISNAAESVCVARDILLAEETGCRLHICHVSTEQSVALIREAKKRGVRVTAETCPHYVAFTEEAVLYHGVNAKMNPPLRSEKDRQAIIEGLLDGTLDCISTDHAPHSKADKGEDLQKSAFGIIGLQTAFPAALTYLCKDERVKMDLFRLIELFSTNPAKILRLDKEGYGVIQEGGRADLTVIDPDSESIITESMLRSRSANTPFIGLTLCGRIEAVCLNGIRRI